MGREMDATSKASQSPQPADTQQDGAAHDDTAALEALLAVLQPTAVGQDRFEGRVIHPDWRRIYGGQVLGQALHAASHTVPPDRPCHSLHAHFLLAGDVKSDVIYEIEHVRNGGSFTTRHIRAMQHGACIFTMTASFHISEASFDHTLDPPNAPPPDELPNLRVLLREHVDQVSPPVYRFLSGPQPFDMRPTDFARYNSRQPRIPHEKLWLRASAPMPASQSVHAAALAYISDFALLQTALIPHGRHMSEPEIQLASLDHAMWFHRPIQLDDWLLYTNTTPTAFGSRGFGHGQFFDQAGRLVATVMQEGLMRLRRPAAETVITSKDTA